MSGGNFFDALSGPGTSWIPNSAAAAQPQYLRKWTLSLGTSVGVGGVAGSAGGGQIVLSTDQPGYDLRCTFHVRQALGVTQPNIAIIRVYNLSPTTAEGVIYEFDTVTLQAGYQQGQYGQIFTGEVKQYKRGRENSVDSYLDIYAADSDLAWRYAATNEVLPPGWTQDDVKGRLQAAQQAVQPKLGIGQAPPSPTGGTFPGARDRVMFGDAAQKIRDWQKTNQKAWSIQNGQIVILGENEYLPGEIVVLTAATGLVGVPEATTEGITIQCLLNPAIRVGGLVKLDNRYISEFFAPGGSPLQGTPGTSFPNWTEIPPLMPSLAPGTIGTYNVRVIDYDGDTRGLPWYNTMVCWNSDQSLGAGAGAVPGGLQPPDGNYPGGGSDAPPSGAPLRATPRLVYPPRRLVPPARLIRPRRHG